MSRPRVSVDHPNRAELLRAHLRGTLGELERLPGVAGIMLNGGLSRGYADELSEIDVTLFLTPNAFREWQNGRSPLTVGICEIRGQLYDVKIIDLEQEQARTWEGVELWDLSYAKILHDPRGALAALKKDKLSRRPSAADAEGPLFSCWWHFRLAGDIWLERGDFLQGHHVLNQALAPLLEALFLANGEYVPHEKWIVHLSRTLEWKPAEWESQLAQALQTGDLSRASVAARQAAIEGLWNDVDEHCRELSATPLPVRWMQKTFYDLLLLLVEKGSVTKEEWMARAPLSLLNADPFHPIVTFDGERITLGREKLLEVTPEEMYSWHYEVLNAARACARSSSKSSPASSTAASSRI